MENKVNEEDLVITGSQLASLTGDEIAYREAIERCLVFAKLSPHQKMEVVQVLQKGGGGRAVAFLGDGVNDALAIRAADVGISVDSGTEIAKEAADVILLEKSLGVICHGVLQGRKTYSNLLFTRNRTWLMFKFQFHKHCEVYHDGVFIQLWQCIFHSRLAFLMPP
jgi:P-type Mg2+ transporter